MTGIRKHNQFFLFPDNHYITNQLLALVTYAHVTRMQDARVQLNPENDRERNRLRCEAAGTIREASHSLEQALTGLVDLSGMEQPRLYSEIGAAVIKSFDAGYRLGIKQGKQLPTDRPKIH